MKNGRWRIGDGGSIDIYKDRWLANRDLISERVNPPYTRVGEILDLAVMFQKSRNLLIQPRQ